MSRKKNQPTEPIDPRLGKRAMYRVGKREVYGTIKTVTRYWTGVEYLHMLTDQQTMIEGRADGFTLLDDDLD